MKRGLTAAEVAALPPSLRRFVETFPTQADVTRYAQGAKEKARRVRQGEKIEMARPRLIRDG